MIRKIIFSATIALFVCQLHAGGVRVDSAIDFTAQDIHGVEQNLFSYLQEGNYVLLDFGAKS